MTSFLVGIIALTAPLAASEKSPPPLPPLQSIRVEPSQVQLHGSNRQQQLLVTGTSQSGQAVDVTHLCEVTSSNSSVVAGRASRLQGVGDGTATVQVHIGKLTAAVPVTVRDFTNPPPVHFGNDVVPLLSKLGCNSGGCHGKASGQNGFKLSVFGFDPEADYNAIVKEARGRRIFPASPEQSLILLKPTGRVPHGGGRRLEAGSTDYVVLQDWLKQGTPVGEANGPHLTALEVSPAQRVLGLKAEQQILATAVFSDGSRRDVTAAAAYTSNAEHVAAAAGGGLVHTGDVAGEAAITVNYMGQVAAVRLQVPRPDAPNPYPALPVNNKIDSFVWSKLKTMGIVPSEVAGDAVFLRRLYLGVLGTLPEPSEVRAFLADIEPYKRSHWIDRILERPEYADYWALIWSDILLVNRDKLGDRGAFELHRWLRSQLAHNRPYDQWVRELITASGSSSRVGPVNFYRASANTEEVARSVSQAFLGIRLECAQCHHHPFEKWSQEDFYGLAGFFNGLERKKMPSKSDAPVRGGEEEVVIHAGYRPMALPLTGRKMAARAPDGPLLGERVEGDPRRELANWMTRPDNPWFARLVVNRLWKHYLGRGLVEPEDDLRSTNPATNEPLLDYLAATLVKENFDLKALTRIILNSRTYQLSSTPNASNRDDEQLGSHFRVRRLPAEVLLDAISKATGEPEAFPGRPRGARAIELWDNRMPSYFLDVFGRSERLTPCACGRSSEPTMAQCLHLMNAPEIERKIAAPTGRIARLLKENATDDQLVEELCLAALGHPVGESERRVARQLFDAVPRQQAAQDFLWVLLNSHEFLFVR
jgi:hypothetical protein